jgi:hypothetical protein
MEAGFTASYLVPQPCCRGLRIQRSGSHQRLCYAPADVSRTPRGREAGESPAQSRYGEPPSGGSPVADHTVHARTFERKVGRTVHTIP